MRLIDADVLIEKCGDWYVEEGTESGFIGTLKNLLATMPTIQTEKAQLSQEGTTSDKPVATDTNVGDTISRQQAIRWVKTECNPYGKPTLEFESGKKVIEHLEQMPPAQPEPQWIPVSERLPEDLEEVNVTWVNRNPESYYEFIKDKPFTATAVYYKGKWYWWSTCAQDLLAEYGERCSVGLLHEAIEVTAWMPLPSPYQKGATP